MCFFTKSSKTLAAMNDDQACLSAKYFHVIASPCLQLAEDDFIKVGVIEYLAKQGMMVSLGLTCAKPRRKMSVLSLVAYAKEGSRSSQKESICQQLSREYGVYLQLNHKVRNNGLLPKDGRHGIVDINPHINPKVLVQCRCKSGGHFCAKHTKEIEGHAVIHE